MLTKKMDNWFPHSGLIVSADSEVKERSHHTALASADAQLLGWGL